MTTQQQTYAWGIIGILVLGGLILWNASEKQTSVTDKPTIGGLFALTGYASFAGEASRDGFTMAIEDSGMDVKSVIEDYQSDVTTVATAANKLISADRVSVVIGPEWTEFSEVIAPIATQSKVTFISPWMEGEGQVFDSQYYFSATPSQRTQIQGMLKYALEQGMKKIVVVYSNNAWSLEYQNIIEQEGSALGIEVAEAFKVKEGQADFRTEVSRIKVINPDAIYMAISTDNDQGVLDRQLKELNANYPVFISLSRAESGVYLEKFRTNARGYFYPALKEHSRIAEFQKKYQQRFGKVPAAITAATTYDMTTLVLKAIKDGARTGSDIQQYLAGVKNYNGYSNKITFDKNRQVESGAVVIKQITDQQPTILKEYNL